MDLLAQSIWGGIGVGVAFFLWLYLGSPAEDGGPTRLEILRQRVNRFAPARAGDGDDAPGADPAPAARTGAGWEDSDAPHPHAGAAGAAGAVRGAEPAIPGGSLLLSADEQRAVAAMVRHKAAVATAKKLDTIQAGWPEIRARSGDPQSKYARASAIYDAIFAPPPPAATPVAGREIPAGVAFPGEPADPRW